jgi:uncharacterized membrane protein
MPWYFTAIKYVHVLSAIVAVGFNFTYAIWLARAQRDPSHLNFALRSVKFLDDRVANPAYILLLISGLSMVFIAHYSLTTFWIAGALALFVILAVVGFSLYTPTLSRQIRTLASHGMDSAEYQALSARGTAVGIALAVIVLSILGLMIFKPTF